MLRLNDTKNKQKTEIAIISYMYRQTKMFYLHICMYKKLNNENKEYMMQTLLSY